MRYAHRANDKEEKVSIGIGSMVFVDNENAKKNTGSFEYVARGSRSGSSVLDSVLPTWSASRNERTLNLSSNEGSG